MYRSWAEEWIATSSREAKHNIFQTPADARDLEQKENCYVTFINTGLALFFCKIIFIIFYGLSEPI